MPPESLRGQLLRWLLLPLLVLFAVNAWFSDRAAVATANQSFDRLLVASADAIAEDITVRDGELIVDLPYAALELLESNLKERLFYRVVGSDGSTVTGYDDLPLPPSLDAASEQPTLYPSEYRGEAIHLVALNKAIYGTAASRPAIIVVAETGESRDALSHELLMDGLLRQGLLIAAAGALLWLALERSLRPLTMLRDSLLKRPSTDLSPIEAADVQSEVRPLIGALNQHTDRLRKLLDGRERFIADASHQMRTPLAEMRTQIDYSLRHGDDALVRATMTDVHAGIDGLARLIGQMLLLARSDPDAIDDQRIAGVDLGALARAAMLDHVPTARANGMDLRFEHSAGRVFVLGNALLLGELMRNLLDNAIRHGRPGGAVTVRVSGYPRATLDIEDDGPGIPFEERELVFERFYRGRTADTTGSGLGLAIARNICLAHRAAISLAAPAAGPGLRVQICFAPRYEAGPAE